jgi:hypothetical protein
MAEWVADGGLISAFTAFVSAEKTVKMLLRAELL